MLGMCIGVAHLSRGRKNALQVISKFTLCPPAIEQMTNKIETATH